MVAAPTWLPHRHGGRTGMVTAPTDGMSEGDGSRKGWLANQDTRSGVQVAIQMLLKWRRTRGTHGGVGLRPLDFRIVAMEATCRTAAVFQSRTQMEANQRNARWTAEVLPSCRDGGDLSTWVLRETQGVGSFSKVGRKKGAAKQWTVASRECRWRSC
jgi:hypothetical protein